MKAQRRFGLCFSWPRMTAALLIDVAGAGNSRPLAQATPGRHHHREPETAPLPVEWVALSLRQFDVRLDSIDIVAVRRRRYSAASGAGKMGSAQTAEPDSAGDGRTWLVLRMDPLHNIAAAATRDSLASTVAAVTERLAEVLDGHDCAARPLTGDELVEVDRAVLAGLQLTRRRPGWRRLKHLDGYAISFGVSPHDIDFEMLAQVWSADTDATVLTIRVRSRPGGAEVSAWVRYHSAKRLPKEVTAALNRLTGRQLAAVRASLPPPLVRPALAVPARILGEHETLALPLAAAARPTIQ